MASKTETAATRAGTTRASDQDISDAYIYLLGRLTVTRQQQLDFQEGFKWNELLHRKPGAVDWPNPNLDVAYSEAWVAVDENCYLLVTVPRITDRYFTVQFLNGWGETLANINARVFPDRPYGEFAVSLKGSNVAIPSGAQRIDLPVKYSRVLLRVELGADSDKAVALQRQFTFKAVGTPKLPEIPKTPIFDLEKLPGVEAFEAAEVALDSEPDTNPGMEKLQANVRAIAKAVKDPAERARVDKSIREHAWPEFADAGTLIGHGTIRNNWVRPKVCGAYEDDWLARSCIDYGGIWANVLDEVLYYKGRIDDTDAPLQSDNTYTLTFPKDDLPAKYAKYFWSVIAVDAKHMRVLPNPLNRFLLNNQSKLEYGKDGSLTLYFAPERPNDAPEGNWLPTLGRQNYSLTFRFYGPRGGVAEGIYYPPPLIKRNTAKASARSRTDLIPVTEANFTRAESHLYFGNSLKGGGAGKFHHFREVMSIDNQTVIRANRDTLYSSGVFDLEAGPVTVTLPDSGGRFMSMIAIDEDEYALETVYAPGQFTYTKEQVGTRYVMLGLRTFVDPNDPKDVEKVHALQDSARAEQPRTGNFEFPNWDAVSQKKVRDDLIKRAASLPDTKGMFGQRGKVDPERHLIGAATGWGGNAPEDALYLTVVPAKNDGKTVHSLTVPGDVPVDGFWSISIYGADGYFHRNDQNAYSINNVTAKKAPDGSVTIQFGGCDGKTANCIPITAGWNYWVRLYRPRKEALTGAYRFPEAVPVK
jgi:hypothetical protein